MANEPTKCATCGQEFCDCPYPLLLQVADALTEKGYNASWEYPGYIAVALPDGRVANFGNANTDYGADWAEGNVPIDFFMPETATMPEVLAAIEGWIIEQTLTPNAADILRNVIEAMRDAEGISGPDDYVPLMQAIAFEAFQRIVGYRAAHGGVQ